MRGTAILLAKTAINSAIQATEKELEIKAPWGKIAALTWGDPSHPPIFLCHGRLDSCSSFRRLVHHLLPQHYYVSVDLPGNGRSDPLPRGARFALVDFVPTLVRIQEHFKWEQFSYIGHSLGSYIGKYYNLIYPGYMSRIVEIDPEPAYITRYVAIDQTSLRAWYLWGYERFYKEFAKNSAGVETAPKYTYEEVRELLMKARGIDEEIADHILERCLMPTDDGKFRITFDQRMKSLSFMPLSIDTMKELYTASPTPTLAILSAETVDKGVYQPHSFVTDESLWPHKNYKSVILEGGHDIHLQKTEEVAGLISEFLETPLK